MKTKILILTLLVSCKLFAQSPHYIQYQAVVRDLGGVVLVNQNVNFKISIISGSVSGTLPMSCKSPARLAILGLSPSSAAMVAHNLETSIECCNRF